MGWPLDPLFIIPAKVLAHFRLALKKGKEAEGERNARFLQYSKAFPALAKEFRHSMAGELSQGWDADIPVFPADPKGMATRIASGEVLNAISHKLSSLMGGSADLDPSTKTCLLYTSDAA